MRYTVQWRLSLVESESPLGAAQKAFEAIQENGTKYAFFDVEDANGQITQVDLNPADGDQPTQVVVWDAAKKREEENKIAAWFQFRIENSYLSLEDIPRLLARIALRSRQQMIDEVQESIDIYNEEANDEGSPPFLWHEPGEYDEDENGSHPAT